MGGSGVPLPLGGVPLSLGQEFLCGFDQGDLRGAFGPRHTLVYGWRVAGRVDRAILQSALDDLVLRHEALRTRLVRDRVVRDRVVRDRVVRDGEPHHQRVEPPVPVPLAVQGLPGGGDRDAAAEAFLIDCDAAAYPVRELPHLRAALGRFDDRDGVLVLAVHHTATDAWSMQLLIRDLAHRYAVRAGAAPPPLPEPGQYREFARWQRGQDFSGPLAHWREQLAGARISSLASDRAGPAGGDYAAHRFIVDAGLTGGVQALATRLRATPFMVLLAVHQLLLRARTGATDVVALTSIAGRPDGRFPDAVGPFDQPLALRTELAGCASFPELVARTRATCLAAYTNDAPFPLVAAGSPGLTADFGSEHRAVVNFELIQPLSVLDGAAAGDLRFTELHLRARSQPLASGVPDGVLWASELLPSGELAATVKYDQARFSPATIEALATEYQQLLRAAVAGPDDPTVQVKGDSHGAGQHHVPGR